MYLSLKRFHIYIYIIYIDSILGFGLGTTGNTQSLRQLTRPRIQPFHNNVLRAGSCACLMDDCFQIINRPTSDIVLMDEEVLKGLPYMQLTGLRFNLDQFDIYVRSFLAI